MLAEYLQRDHNDLVAVLSTPEGRRLFMRIIGFTKWWDPPKVFGNRMDDIETGRRSVGGDLYAMTQELGLKGLDLVQLAQREFVATQIEQQDLLDHRLKELKETQY